MAVGCFKWYRNNQRPLHVHTLPYGVDLGSHKDSGAANEESSKRPSAVPLPIKNTDVADVEGLQPSGAYGSVTQTGVVSLRDPVSVRNSLILTSTTDIITIVTLNGYKCIYQNPASVLWFGAIAEEGSIDSADLGQPSNLPGGPAKCSILDDIFACDNEKLLTMLEEVVLGDGAWKGVIRVQSAPHDPTAPSDVAALAVDSSMPLTPSRISLHTGISIDGTGGGPASHRSSRSNLHPRFQQTEPVRLLPMGSPPTANGEFYGRSAALASAPGMVIGVNEGELELSDVQPVDATSCSLPVSNGASADKLSDTPLSPDAKRRSLDCQQAAGSGSNASILAISQEGSEGNIRLRSALCGASSQGASRLGPQRRSFCMPNHHQSQGSLSPIPSSSMLPLFSSSQVQTLYPHQRTTPQRPSPQHMRCEALDSNSGTIVVLATGCDEADCSQPVALFQPAPKPLRPASEPAGAVRSLPMFTSADGAPRLPSRITSAQPSVHRPCGAVMESGNGDESPGSSVYLGVLADCSLGSPPPQDSSASVGFSNGNSVRAITGNSGGGADCRGGGNGCVEAKDIGGYAGNSGAGGENTGSSRGGSGGGAAPAVGNIGGGGGGGGDSVGNSGGGTSRSRSNFRALLGKILSRSIRELGGRAGSVSPASLTGPTDSVTTAASSAVSLRTSFALRERLSGGGSEEPSPLPTQQQQGRFAASASVFSRDASAKLASVQAEPSRDAGMSSPLPPHMEKLQQSPSQHPRVRISVTRPDDCSDDASTRSANYRRLPVRRIQSSQAFRPISCSTSGSPDGVLAWFSEQSGSRTVSGGARPTTATGLVSRPSSNGRAALRANCSFIVPSSPAISPLPLPQSSHAVAFAGSLRAAPTAALALAVGANSNKRRSSIASESGATAEAGDSASVAGGGGGASGIGGGSGRYDSGTNSVATLCLLATLDPAFMPEESPAVQGFESTPPLRHRLGRVAVENEAVAARDCSSQQPTAGAAEAQPPPPSTGDELLLDSPFGTEAAATAVVSAASFVFTTAPQAYGTNFRSSAPAAFVAAALPPAPPPAPTAASAPGGAPSSLLAGQPMPRRMGGTGHPSRGPAVSYGGGSGGGGAPLPVVTTAEVLVRKLSALGGQPMVQGGASAAAAAAAVEGAGAGAQEVWHEVWARRALDPILDEDVIIISQHDVTARVVAERHLGLVLETEHRLLEQLYPRHILKGIVEDWATEVSQKPNDSAGSSWRPGVRDPYSTATWHPKVTLLFADIVGFTPMCKEVEPRAVMHMLNALFSRFDARLDEFGVFKVETIGDCYFIAGGLVDTDEDGMANVRTDRSVNPGRHARRVFGFAKAMLAAAKEVPMPTTGQPVRIRIGMHTGPVVSGVVGTRMPRFCLFGDTVNTASRMESTGVPGCIHVSEATYVFLQDEEGWEPTGGIEVKGKGHMRTFVNSPRLNESSKGVMLR